MLALHYFELRTFSYCINLLVTIFSAFIQKVVNTDSAVDGDDGSTHKRSVLNGTAFFCEHSYISISFLSIF